MFVDFKTSEAAQKAVEQISKKPNFFSPLVSGSFSAELTPATKAMVAKYQEAGKFSGRANQTDTCDFRKAMSLRDKGCYAEIGNGDLSYTIDFNFSF